MIVISWTVGLTIVNQLHDSIPNMFRDLSETHPGFLQIGTEGSTMSGMAYTTTILVSTIGFLMWPHLFSKSYATKARTIKKTVLVYPVFALFLIPLLFVGFSAVNVIQSDQIGSPDEILPFLITIPSSQSARARVYGLVGAGALSGSHEHRPRCHYPQRPSL